MKTVIINAKSKAALSALQGCCGYLSIGDIPYICIWLTTFQRKLHNPQPYEKNCGISLEMFCCNLKLQFLTR